MKALSIQAQEALSRIGSADIVVGIPSYNSVKTIGRVVAQVASGLSTYFGDKDCLVLVSDGGSTDETLQVASNLQIPSGLKLITFAYQGVSGKGTAVKAIFEAAIRVGADSVAMVDSDLQSITPEWIKLLIGPTLSGVDLMTPKYIRHKYDGTITNQLCYPLTRALYGLRIRQPIGGDFGLSGRLVNRLIESRLWESPYVPRFGIDIFITSSAAAERFVVEEADLGAKIHATKDPADHLASMFREVAGSAFTCMQEYEIAWRKVKGSGPIPLRRDGVERIDPTPVAASATRMAEQFRTSYAQLSALQSTLSKDLRHQLDSLAASDAEELVIPTAIWCKTVYEVAAKFKISNDAARESLLEGLRAVWIGRVASFVSETAHMSNEEAETVVENDATHFERTKNELVHIY